MIQFRVINRDLIFGDAGPTHFHLKWLEGTGAQKTAILSSQPEFRGHAKCAGLPYSLVLFYSDRQKKNSF